MDEANVKGTDQKEHNRARMSAMNMLARREQSQKELENKLSVRFDPGVVRDVIKELQNEGLQSDERFVESFVASKVRNGQGPIKISYELRNKGVNSDLVAGQLEIYGEDWLELAKEILHRKFGEEPPVDHKERQKRQRFVASRGFPNDICYKLFG